MRSILFALVLTAAASPVVAQSATGYGAPVSLEVAQGVIDRAVAYGAANGWRLAVAVVEPSGELVAFGRMDDSPYGSIPVAQRKAETAARYRIPTAVMEERVQGGRLVTLSNPEALAIAGGVPIVMDGRIVGAIGVSGATAAQDADAAAAALAGL
jgi:uncharacterized protein GlcG (DUF336 family)